jgi:hypothetical protein
VTHEKKAQNLARFLWNAARIFLALAFRFSPARRRLVPRMMSLRRAMSSHE